MKISLINETLSTITLADVSEEIENIGASRVVFNFGTNVVTLDGTTTPASYNFINPALNVMLDLSSDKFENGVTEFDYFVCYLGHRQFNITERNLFNAVDILDDFHTAEWIALGNEFYQVDITKSSQNQLFLKTHVNGTPSYYEVVYKDTLFFTYIERWRKKFAEMITELTTCDTCQDIDKLTKVALHLTALKAAERCDNVDEAKSIAKFIKDLLERDLSC